jgi:uncharacterized protein YjbJ (UPF0337 family)
MSSITDKIKGVANEVVGTVKEAAGHALGDEKLEVEGSAQKLKGKAQETLGDAKDAVKKVIDKA